MNILLVTNSKYLESAYILLFSLFDQHPDTGIDIYLAYESEGLSENEREGLVAFVTSFAEKNIYFIDVGKEFKKKIASQSGIGVETYYRILAIDLLPSDLERILYLDVDMVIKGSLDQLYSVDFNRRPFVVCDDIYGRLHGFYCENKQRLQIPEEYSYFNAGVMLYNLCYLRETNAMTSLLERIYENHEKYVYNDQDVINQMYYKELIYVGWDLYNCPPAWYYLELEALKRGCVAFAGYRQLEEMQFDQLQSLKNITQQIYDNAKVIHYLGNTKPWDDKREAAKVYEIFDQAYIEYKKRLEDRGKKE